MMALAAVVLAGATLYEQSAARLLENRFRDPRISYLYLNASTGEILGARWQHPERAVAPGSLVKPFTALAYGEAHGFRFPEYVCRGKASKCWLPQGHGRLDIAGAIAHSCNAWFLALRVPLDDVKQVAERFGIEPPGAGATPATLAGFGDRWKITPAALARAYCRLLQEPQAVQIVRGMTLSATLGTGRAVGTGLVKTGTAPCSHERKAPGDGFVIVLFPAEAPRHALLVRVHGVPGAEAARTAGEMLRALEENK